MIKIFGYDSWDEEYFLLGHISNKHLHALLDFAAQNNLEILSQISCDCNTYLNQNQILSLLNELNLVEKTKIIPQETLDLLRKSAQKVYNDYQFLLFTSEL